MDNQAKQAIQNILGTIMSGNDKSAGYSLLEVLIACGILSAISYGLVSTFNKHQESNLKSSAKASAKKEIESLMAVIKKDQMLQIPGGTHVVSNGKALEIQRIKPNQSDPTVSYSVQFQSECSPLRPNQAEYQKVFTEAFRKKVYNDPLSCLSRMNCPAGHYPSVHIIAQGLTGSEYSPTSYPVLRPSVRAGPAGFAICAEQLSDQIRITLESIVVRRRSDSYEAERVTQFLVIPLNSPSDLVYVPN